MVKLNLEKMSHEAFKALNAIDEFFIGTKDYMGIAYFWNSEYKFLLRECGEEFRRKVHNAWLKEGLILDERSEKHEAVLNNIYSKDKKAQQLYKKKLGRFA